MDHRKEELEKKRAKLAELRRQREERKRVTMQTQEQQPASSAKADAQDINDLVDSLVGDRPRAPASPLSTGTPGIMSRETSGMGRDRSISVATSAAGTQMGSPVSRAMTPAGTMTATVGGGNLLGPRALPEFKTCDFVVFDFPPKERVVYNKEVQTTDSMDMTDTSGLVGEEEIERRVKELRDSDERARVAREEERARREAEARAKESEIKRLTDEQRARILESSDFAAFVDQKSRVMERALDADYDVM
ncbi:hypothetical protein GGI21_004582, partial [Coemansia aciculifera]